MPKDGSFQELFGPQVITALHRGKAPRHDPIGSDDVHANTHIDASTEEWEGRTLCEDDDEPPDEDSWLLEELLSRETTRRGRPKALCYEDISLMVVRHPVTEKDGLAMAVKFIHHKGVDNNPKPYVAWCYAVYASFAC